MNVLLDKITGKLISDGPSQEKKPERHVLPATSVAIDWNKMLEEAKQAHIRNSGNNAWSIGNDYYTANIKEAGKITLVAENENKELQDFRMLLKLLKEKKVKASFVLMPLNAFYYSNITEMDPVINTVRKEIESTGLPFLDMWNSDKTKYDAGVLRDVMHLGDYGWLKVDRFIIETYKLQK